MTKMRLLTALPLFILLSFAPVGFAQEQGQNPSQNPSQDQQQMPQHDTTQMQLEQSVTGELKSVDTDAKKFVVATAEGTDMEFVYNEQTQCGGAQDTIEGLSTSAGSQVTVHYRDENQQKIATRIEVQPASQTEETPQVSPQEPGTDTPPSSPGMQEPGSLDTNQPPSNPEQPLPETQNQPE